MIRVAIDSAEVVVLTRFDDCFHVRSSRWALVLVTAYRYGWQPAIAIDRYIDATAKRIGRDEAKAIGSALGRSIRDPERTMAQRLIIDKELLKKTGGKRDWPFEECEWLASLARFLRKGGCEMTLTE